MFPKPDFKYGQSIQANFIKISDILKNPYILKYIEEKDIKVLKESQEKLKEEVIIEVKNKLYDA